MEQEFAYAKINLSLDVLGRREDGYHDLRMVMETVSLHDTLGFVHEGEGIRVKSNLSFLPEDQSNLAGAAARRFGEAVGQDMAPLIMEIQKEIPVCAGLAGGSSDAAAVLRYLNRHFHTELGVEALQKIGEKIGSDVPYCVGGGTALAEGRGEILTPLPALPRCWFVLCKPGFSVSTPALFAQLDRKKLRRRPDTNGLIRALWNGDLIQAARRFYNVFENVLPPRQNRLVTEIKNSFIQLGALGAAMSGTGPTVYGVFAGRDLAQTAFETWKDRYPDTFLVQNV